MDLSTSLVAVLLLICAGLVALVGFAVRRRALTRGGGTFDCSLRESLASHGRGWTLGVARYRNDDIEWFRAFSWSPRPRRRFTRGELRVRSRRKPAGPEALSLAAGAVIVQCAHQSGVIELGMAEDALMGFLAWLEASPPGQGTTIA